MRFLRKNDIQKTILVISDIHLGAGVTVNGKRNSLEDFYHDKELVEFIEYYSNDLYGNKEVELIINGDLFDLLAVPFVPFFDDEYWCEDASFEKLKLILEAHQEVINALIKFSGKKNKKIVYILGNHDAELIFESLREHLISLFPEKNRENIRILFETDGEYCPLPQVVVKHGHDYEIANDFHPEDSFFVGENGKKYFIPPWGSYFVTRVINKFKEERAFVNQVRPIRSFIIKGLIYDTLFTLRFAFACIFYYFMVRFIYFFKRTKNLNEVLQYLKNELKFLSDIEEKTKEYFANREEVEVLIVGHTHDPFLHTFPNGSTFINTGTWINMHFLGFGHSKQGAPLTYAQIDLKKTAKKGESELDISLNSWKGCSQLPYEEFYSSGTLSE
jgi:UDP-2,3-diacylglucosamine pyrophosphatase LpxH